jgi:tetratricopeptide (TPR) repeat protein
MAKEFERAEEAGGEGADPRASLVGHIDCLLKKKEDPKAALPIIERYAKVAESTDYRPHALLGEARRMMKDYAGAVEPFAKAVEMNGKSKMAVWGLAESSEKTGDVERAIGQYRAYAEQWPEDEKARKAKGSAERLERKRK